MNKKGLLAALFLSSICIGLTKAQTPAERSNQTEQTDSLDENIMLKNLPEVMVKGEQPIAKLERGRLTYNMPLLLSKIPADNAFEAIRNIPGVSMNDEQVKFGGQPVTLVINGKSTTLSANEVMERLKMMPADQLQKAQVMLSAPANFHVRGAVINVETKSFTKSTHTSGQVQGVWNQSKYGAGTGKLNLLHSTNKLILDANYGFKKGKSYGEVEHMAQHPLNGNRIPYYDLTTNSTKNTSHSYRIGGDYRIAERHQLSVAYSGTQNEYNSNNKTLGDSKSNQKSAGDLSLHNVDADYILPFGLRLSASYLKYNHSKGLSLLGSIFETERNLLSESDQEIDKWLVTADQSHDMKNGWGLVYGAKAQFTRNDSYQKTLTMTGQELPEGTSHVDIDEQIINGYVGFSKQWSEKLSMDASITLENFHSPQWNEWYVYPTLNILWNATEKHLFNLSFTSDSEYPSYWSTMNSIHYSSTYSEIWGNPYLKPARSYNTSLMWQWLKRYTFTAFATLEPNTFMQLPYQPSDRMAVIMKEINFDYRNIFGLQAGAQYKAGKWLNGNVSLTALYTKDKCDDFFDIPFDRSKFSCIASATVAVLFSQRSGLRLIVNPFFQSNAIQGVYDIKNIFALNSSLRWASKDTKWNLTLAGNNLTNRRFRSTSTWRGQHFGMEVCQDWISAALTATYRFGNYKEKKTKPVNTSRMGF